MELPDSCGARFGVSKLNCSKIIYKYMMKYHITQRCFRGEFPFKEGRVKRVFRQQQNVHTNKSTLQSLIEKYLNVILMIALNHRLVSWKLNNMNRSNKVVCNFTGNLNAYLQSTDFCQYVLLKGEDNKVLMHEQQPTTLPSN